MSYISLLIFILKQQLEERFMRSLDREVILGIRPEHLYDASVSTHLQNRGSIRAVVEVCEFLGSEALLVVQTGKHRLTARIEEHGDIRSHQEIELIVNIHNMHLFDPSSGESY